MVRYFALLSEHGGISECGAVPHLELACKELLGASRDAEAERKIKHNHPTLASSTCLIVFISFALDP